jgi:hypothetical protein
VPADHITQAAKVVAVVHCGNYSYAHTHTHTHTNVQDKNVLYVQVRIVREKNTSKIMAMKKLKKSEMLRRGQVKGGVFGHGYAQA